MSRKMDHKDVFQDTLKQLYLSLKGISSYPKGHPASIRPIQKTLQMISEILKKTNVMTISVVNNRLLMNNIPIDRHYDFCFKFMKDLTNRNVASFTFVKGLSQADLKTFLMILSERPDQLQNEGGVSRILKSKGIDKIKVDEIKYAQIIDETAKQQDHDTYNMPLGGETSLEDLQDPFPPTIEDYPIQTGPITEYTTEIPEFREDYIDSPPQSKDDVRRIAKHMIDNGADWEKFKNALTSILSTLDKKTLAHFSENNVTLKGKKTEIVNDLIDELFYDTIAESYIASSIQIGKYDHDFLKRLLPLKKQINRALAYIEKRLSEYGRPADIIHITNALKNGSSLETQEVSLEEPGTLTLEESEDMIMKEVEGSTVEDTHYLSQHTEEIKQKITGLLSSGRMAEAKAIIDHYSKRLDDKSWQIRKNVAEGFSAILSVLDEFDKIKESFCDLSNTFLSKVTEKLKNEDHVDSYLALTETYQTICQSQDKKDKYFIDETLGHRLFIDKKLSDMQLQQVLTTRKTNKKSIQYNLAALNYINESTLLHYLSEQFKGFSMLNVTEIENIPNHILETIPVKYAKRYYSLPFKLDDQRLFTALDNPRDMEKISDLEFISGYSIVPFAAAEFFLIQAIDRFYNIQGSSDIVIDQVIQEIKQEEEILEYIEEKDNETAALDEFEGAKGPVVKLVNVILKEAISKGASDIHIEPYEDDLRVRFRVDGSLIQIMSPPYKYKNGIASRIKIMSRLNISEKRLPQDGRFKIKMDEKCIDLRVSTFPGTFGEKVVLRLLDKSNLQIDISKLGMQKEDLKILTSNMCKSKGMILVTGPTGSGKTTTLYSVLQKLNDGSRNISTAEDPIEYNISGINQFQMNFKIGLDFAMALRSFLRQDPDIIMVGEMRDFETAEIAVKAALTGHLVLSTLHTNSSFETITRLLEMGIEPFLVASSIDLIIAQRLMRKICPDCREETALPEMHLDYLRKLGLDIETTKPYAGKGCSKCNKTGYKGRFAIYEVLPMWHEIREMIINKESVIRIQKKAEELGVKTLQQNGILKVKQGMTTIDELMRVAI